VTTTFDSWAWIEHFAGTANAQDTRKLLGSSEEICTPALCLLEIKAKFIREKKPFQAWIDFICMRSRIVDLNKEIALKAAEYKAEGLHTSDAIVYATAQAVQSTLLTGDEHFKKLPDVRLLQK